MKFTVEVEEFYMEEEDLSSALKIAIKNDVINQIRDNIKSQVSSFMDSHIKAVLNTEIQTRVQIAMDEIVSVGKVKGPYSSDPEMTVSDWIKKQFTAKNADITKSINSKVDTHVKELQNRYDLLFATQLITKMKDAGMLNEQAAQILIASDVK